MLFSSVHLLLQHLLPALLMSQIWSKQYNTTSTDEECIAAYQQLPSLFFTCCALTNSGPSAVSRMHIFINQIIWHDQLMCNSAAFVALPGITLPAWHHNIVCFVIKVFKRRPESCRGVFSHVCVCVWWGGGGRERGRERKREGGREGNREALGCCRICTPLSGFATELSSRSKTQCAFRCQEGPSWAGM